MKTYVLVAALILGAGTTSAIAAGPYIGGSAGATFYHDSRFSDWRGANADISYDPGSAANAYGGYGFDNGCRVEGELGVKYAELDRFIDGGHRDFVDDASLSIVSFMANAFYDIDTGFGVNPFLGAGVGILHGILEEFAHDEGDTVFGYQLSAGLSLPVRRNLKMDISYRFQGAGSDFEINGTKTSYHSSSVLVGVRYYFGR